MKQAGALSSPMATRQGVITHSQPHNATQKGLMAAQTEAVLRSETFHTDDPQSTHVLTAAAAAAQASGHDEDSSARSPLGVLYAESHACRQLPPPPPKYSIAFCRPDRREASLASLQQSNDDSVSYERREKRPLKRNLTCQIKHFPMLWDRFHVFPSGVHKKRDFKSNAKSDWTNPPSRRRLQPSWTSPGHQSQVATISMFSLVRTLGVGPKKTSFFSKLSVGFHSVFCFSNQSCCNTAPQTHL